MLIRTESISTIPRSATPSCILPMIFLPVEKEEEGADDALGQLAKEEQCQCHHLCSQIDVTHSFLAIT